MKSGLLSRYDLFIFDWDGTLNSMRFLFRMNEAVKRALHMWNRDSRVKRLNLKEYDLKRKIRSEETRSDTIYSMMDLFLNFSRPKLHNDSLKLLSKLRKNGKKIALFSNARGNRIAKELAYLGIADYFDVVVSAQDLKIMKPNPSGLNTIMRTLKAKPGRTIYIGDMVDDILTARLARVSPCAISDGFDSHHTLKSARPDHIFRSIEELLKAL